MLFINVGSMCLLFEVWIVCICIVKVIFLVDFGSVMVVCIFVLLFLWINLEEVFSLVFGKVFKVVKFKWLLLC